MNFNWISEKLQNTPNYWSQVRIFKTFPFLKLSLDLFKRIKTTLTKISNFDRLHSHQGWVDVTIYLWNPSLVQNVNITGKRIRCQSMFCRYVWQSYRYHRYFFTSSKHVQYPSEVIYLSHWISFHRFN